jgi:hypothetical protein
MQAATSSPKVLCAYQYATELGQHVCDIVTPTKEVLTRLYCNGLISNPFRQTIAQCIVPPIGNVAVPCDIVGDIITCRLSDGQLITEQYSKMMSQAMGAMAEHARALANRDDIQLKMNDARASIAILESQLADMEASSSAFPSWLAKNAGACLLVVMLVGALLRYGHPYRVLLQMGFLSAAFLMIVA